MLLFLKKRLQADYEFEDKNTKYHFTYNKSLFSHCHPQFITITGADLFRLIKNNIG
jgi:hypothetical protein